MFRKLWGRVARRILLLNPFRCRKCCGRLRKMGPDDLSDKEAEDIQRAGLLWFVLEYGYFCGKCGAAHLIA